ncbi:MAG TPA: LamG-like jellyroll fold domain-containing protein, partial [Candidatus Acidoferrales bacterium]|nr:LamG-like jellyroll fold domain-containing protein [Candidatus Acidoferrales bacterium]
MKIKSLKAFALFLTIPLMVTAAKGQSAYSNAVINLKPVAYWPLQETAQPPAADIETNYGSLGPIANGYYASDANIEKGLPGAIIGDSDTAVEFTNNSQSFMIVPTTDNRVSLVAGGPITVEAWEFPTANQQFVALVSQTGPIGSGGNNAGTNTAGWSLNQNWLPYKGTAVGNNSLLGFSFHVFNGVGSTGGAEADAVVPIANGNWYHVVGVFDGTNCVVYVNGVNDTTYQIPMIGKYVPDTWDPVEFGCNRGLGANPYHGGIDEVAVYTNALSSAQVSNHYNIAVQNISGNYLSTVLGDNPYMYWRMDAPVYTWPASGTYPGAGNYGSLASSVTNYNTTGHTAVYQPGTLPGVPGPSLPGFGSFTNACAFNGLVGGVDAGYESALDPTGNTNAFTVVGWFRDNPADNNSRFNTLAGHSDSSWRFKIQNGSSLWNYGGASSPQQSISPATDNVNDGNWHMFACIYDTTNVTEVLDGYYSSTATSTNNIAGKPTMDTFLGASPDYLEPTNNTYNTAQQYFAGRLAHVAFFTNALTGSQIANLYTTAAGGATPAPTVTAQPFPYPSVRTVGGGSGSFIFEAVVAEGAPVLSYQWYFNTSSNYAGATPLVDDDANYTNSKTSQVTITNLTAAQTGFYFCIVSDSFGSATSAIVNVQVQMSPIITAQNPSGSFGLYPNQTASLSVTALGASPLTYQWYTNGVADTTAGTGPNYSSTALVNGS